MKAITWKEYGPPEVLHLEDVEKPIPAADEIRIKVHAVNVFPGDCELRRFQTHPSMWLPLRLFVGIRRPRSRFHIMGQEMAGVVESVGREVGRFEPDDEIYGLTQMRWGAYAEYVCLPASYPLVRKPESISFEEASTISVGGGHALHFVRKADVRAGEKVLVNGSCGSIGTYLVQLAKLAGAEVTAVDSADKLSVLTSIGADKVIDYQTEDFTRAAEKYDVIFDVVGKSHFTRSLKSLTANGRYVLVNHGLTVMLRGWLVSRLGNKKVLYSLANPSKEDLNELTQLIVEGKIKPVVDRVYPLDQVVDAHRYIDSGKRTGQVVLTLK